MQTGDSGIHQEINHNTIAYIHYSEMYYFMSSFKIFLPYENTI